MFPPLPKALIDVWEKEKEFPSGISSNLEFPILSDQPWEHGHKINAIYAQKFLYTCVHMCVCVCTHNNINYIRVYMCGSEETQQEFEERNDVSRVLMC